MQHSMWGRSYKDLASAFSALLCEWEATTRRTSDRPNLRKLLGPHFTFNMGMPHLTHMLEPGDIAYIDYPPPTLTSTTRFGDATQVTFIRNVADDIRISCGITDETLKMAHEDTQTLSLGRPRVCCRSLYSKSLLARSHSSIAWHGARDRKINAYLANIQNEMAREYGVTSGHRLLFMVVSVTQLVNSTLEWSSIPSDGRAILESQAGRLQRVHEDNPGFYFHPNITTPWEADAVNPWGYWSTSPQWAPLGEREEYIIPSVSSEQAFWNTPEVEVECYRVKAVIDATEPYGYTIAVIDEY
ncbi:hypothetical protein PLICRDRAFT_37289 [Plicaturopsis crispa FD-325 SS-3]|nr:hypothetical protein PLICRDRAFT_37289 [Plicaturopsis crispa FD-325 SS-3]